MAQCLQKKRSAIPGSSAIIKLNMGEICSESISQLSLTPNRSSSSFNPTKFDEGEEGLSKWEKWLARFVTIGHLMLCLPVNFDWKTHRFRMTKNRIIIWIFYVRLLLLTLDNIYLLGAARHVKPEKVTSKELLDFYQHLLTRCLANVNMFALAVDFKSTTQLLNILLITRKRWKGKFGHWTETVSGPVARRMTTFFKISCIFLPLQAFIPCAMYFNSRRSRRYWPAHFFSREMYNSFPLVIGTAINDFHLGSMSIINAGYGGFVILNVFIILTFWIQTLSKKLSENVRRSGPILFTPLLQYKSLLLLNRMMTACIGGHLIPCSLSGAFWTNVSLFTMTITSFHLVPLPVKLNLSVSAMLLLFALKEVLQNGGFLLSKSIHLKRLFLARNLDPHERRYLRSCREIRMYVGHFFYAKAGTFLTFMKLLLDQTITALFSL